MVKRRKGGELKNFLLILIIIVFPRMLLSQIDILGFLQNVIKQVENLI